jgi:hypothetical protein
MKHIITFCIAVLMLSGDMGRADVIFTKHLIDGDFLYVSSVSAGDINGDGLVDVLGTAANLNMVAWWSNDGVGIDGTRLVIDSAFAGATFAVAVDLDLDGLMDVVGTAWYDSEVAWWKSDGGNPPQWTKQTIDSTFEEHTRCFRLTWTVTRILTSSLLVPQCTTLPGGRIWAVPPQVGPNM